MSPLLPHSPSRGLDVVLCYFILRYFQLISSYLHLFCWLRKADVNKKTNHWIQQVGYRNLNPYPSTCCILTEKTLKYNRVWTSSAIRSKSEHQKYAREWIHPKDKYIRNKYLYTGCINTCYFIYLDPSSTCYPTFILRPIFRSTPLSLHKIMHYRMRYRS